jgi:hypothetical protein
MKIEVTVEELKSYNKFLPYTQEREKINEVRTSHLTDDMQMENQQLLERCRAYYESLSDFRERRERAFDYYRGRQWNDLITDDEGNVMTEEDYIKARGKVPYKNNVIRQLLRNIIGQMLGNKSKPNVIARKTDDSTVSEMLTNVLQSIEQRNEVELIEARNFEELLLSGAMLDKSTYAYWPELDLEDVYTENVSPDRIFFNTNVKDPRLNDLRLIGEIIDMPLDDIVASFAKDEEDAALIRGWYTQVTPKNVAINMGEMGKMPMNSIDFYIPTDNSLARLIEVWERVTDWRVYAHDYLTGEYVITKLSLEEIAAVNEERIRKGIEAGMKAEDIPLIDAHRKLESFWTVKNLTPYGQCLYQSETPYKHQSHPYTVTLYPLINGEIWGLVEDIIDQQRNINRQFAMMDFIMGAAAKGVLMVPEDAIPDDMDIDDIADEWTKYNGVIKFKAKPGVPIPQQISSSIANIGTIIQMLELQMREIQQISGVSGAIQGHEAKSGTPNSLYINQAAYSSTNVKDFMNVFIKHKRKREKKMLQLAQQYYTGKRYVGVSGNRYSEEAKVYDPSVKDFDFDIVISEGTDTPVYREIIAEQLFKLLEMNKIDVSTYLENSGMPYADQVLTSIKNQQQEAAKQNPEQAQALMQQLQNRQLTQTDPNGNVISRTRVQ